MKDLKTEVLTVTYRLHNENYRLKNELGIKPTTIKGSQRIVPFSINVEHALSPVELVKAIFENLKQNVLAKISELLQENSELEQRLRRVQIQQTAKPANNMKQVSEPSSSLQPLAPLQSPGQFPWPTIMGGDNYNLHGTFPSGGTFTAIKSTSSTHTSERGPNSSSSEWKNSTSSRFKLETADAKVAMAAFNFMYR